MERKTVHERLRTIWDRYKFVLLVVLIGVVLLAWPSAKQGNQTGQTSPGTAQVMDDAEQSCADTEAKMEEILSRISGVGELHLMLTVDSGAQLQLAQDTELSYSGATAAPDDYSRKSDTVVLSGDSGDNPVVTGRNYPVYRGALVVCSGGGSAEVRLAVTQAVAALTGLSSERITVVKCQ